MSRDRRAGQRSLRRMVDAARRGGTLGSQQAGLGGGYVGPLGVDLDPDIPGGEIGGPDGGGGTVVITAKPKFVVGHPTLGSLADPIADSAWEV